MTLPEARRSAAWRTYLRTQYRLLRLVDPLLRSWVHAVGLGNTVELVTAGRRTGRRRSVLVGLLNVDGAWYVGHPNGPAQWTRNLAAAGHGEVRVRRRRAVAVRAERLPPGHEREAAILATFSQHPFPGNAIYWLARRHIQAVGDYFRLERF
ncbi:MAG TPA: nitroreductase/quinone reductase family protein [Candidatus Limnocylindrales bacterium]